MSKGVPSDWVAMMAAEDKRAGLPTGTTYNIVKTETGFQDRFINDPAAAHYTGPNPKSSAAGLGGILKGTAANPGYGVAPLKDWSAPEQFRFIADYAAARIKQTGSVEAGLAAYGEGKPYAQKVMGKSNAAPVQVAQAQSSPVVPEVQSVAQTDPVAKPIQIAEADLVDPRLQAQQVQPEVDPWMGFQQAMVSPVKMADLNFGSQRPMPVVQPNFGAFSGFSGRKLGRV